MHLKVRYSFTFSLTYMGGSINLFFVGQVKAFDYLFSLYIKSMFTIPHVRQQWIKVITTWLILCKYLQLMCVTKACSKIIVFLIERAFLTSHRWLSVYIVTGTKRHRNSFPVIYCRTQNSRISPQNRSSFTCMIASTK